jgi:hypothetical protein
MMSFFIMADTSKRQHKEHQLLFDNEHLVRILVLNMLPYLNIWTIERLAIVSTTFRSVIASLHRDIAFWCGPIAGWLNYVDDEKASKLILKKCVNTPGPFHRDVEIDIINAKYYKTMLATNRIHSYRTCHVETFLNIIQTDDSPVDEIFISVVNSIRKDILYNLILSIFIQPHSTTDDYFNAKCQHVIRTTCDLWCVLLEHGRCNGKLFNMVLHQCTIEKKWLKLIAYSSSDIYKLVSIRKVCVFNIYDHMNHISALMLLKDATLLDQFMRLLDDPSSIFKELKKHRGWGSKLFRACNQQNIINVLQKYIPADSLNYTCLSADVVCWDRESIAIQLDDIEYIEKLYETPIPLKNVHGESILSEVVSIDMFIRVWTFYKIDKVNFIRDIGNICLTYSNELITQVLDYINPDSLSPYYSRTRKIGFIDEHVLLDWESKKQHTSTEAIEFFLGKNVNLSLQVAHKTKTYSWSVHALKRWKLGLPYIIDCDEYYEMNNMLIGIITNATMITPRALERIARGLINYPKWKEIASVLVVKFPEFIGCLAKIPFHHAAFVMEHLQTRHDRELYLQSYECSVSTPVDPVKLYRLSIQYDVSLNRLKYIFYN